MVAEGGVVPAPIVRGAGGGGYAQLRGTQRPLPPGPRARLRRRLPPARAARALPLALLLGLPLSLGLSLPLGLPHTLAPVTHHYP